ncbi:hypothetical protein L596_000818 [Steinernema carpocapsae]|uniref:Uncharacterized protein n=1 Tax=Steinernema carpocapsae TaxID=34508 RepID=A0A4U8UJJ4_STECR|nr:hypothetical protein L596_000818 [Steinernema carpocapsae]
MFCAQMCLDYGESDLSDIPTTISREGPPRIYSQAHPLRGAYASSAHSTPFADPGPSGGYKMVPRLCWFWFSTNGNGSNRSRAPSTSNFQPSDTPTERPPVTAVCSEVCFINLKKRPHAPNTWTTNFMERKLHQRKGQTLSRLFAQVITEPHAHAARTYTIQFQMCQVP